MTGCNEAQILKRPNMPKFNKPTELVRRIYVERTRKIRKTWQQKITIMRLKNRNPQKIYLGLLLNVHAKIKPHNSIWRGHIFKAAVF